MRQVVINGKNLQIPKSKAGKGHYLEILQKTVGQLDSMLEFHSKVLIYRVDLHLHVGAYTSEVLSSFLRRYKKGLKPWGHKRLGYIWCREQAKSDKPHYHLAFIVNGNVNQRPNYLIDLATYYWQTWEAGSIFVPKNCYYQVSRGDDAAYQKVFERLSYLAKVDTKGNKPKPANDYGGSRMQAKELP